MQGDMWLLLMARWLITENMSARYGIGFLRFTRGIFILVLFLGLREKNLEVGVFLLAKKVCLGGFLDGS
jgi:hypothetical protein